jgi:transposase
MSIMERKQPRRRSSVPEFKAETVERYRPGNRTIGQVARDFDLTETVARAWVTRAETDAGERPGLTSSGNGSVALADRRSCQSAAAGVDSSLDGGR